MKIEKQLSIFLDNRPGTLAKVCATLAKMGINLIALSVSDTVDHAVIRMVVSDPKKAAHLLGNAGILVLEKDVVCLAIPNQAGALSRVSGRLAKAKINIEYAYCTAARGNKQGLLVLRTDNPKRTLQALRK